MNIILDGKILHKYEFLSILAEFIELEAAANPDNDTPEPYRAAGDRLVDAALEFIE